MPRRKYKGFRPGASLPANLKAPFLTDAPSDGQQQLAKKCCERLNELLSHYSIRRDHPDAWFF
jgi:hypothetical protein